MHIVASFFFNSCSCLRNTIETGRESSKEKLIASAYLIAEESGQVEEMAKKIALACTEEGLQQVYEECMHAWSLV